MIEQGGLMIRESESDRLMQNLTNVRITVDTDITDYNNRALGSEEAHYSGLAVDESIKVTPTGRQTDVGKSVNTYTIDWGTANRSNYEVSEDLGNLTVTPASATITTGSASKAYDGTPLTNSEASISGLVAGETATVTTTGTITEVGSTVNTYTIDWGTAAPGNYTVSEDLGTLQVTAAAPTPAPEPYGPVTLTSASASKTYDGTALTDSSVTAEGLPSGFTVSATVSGSQTDAGSSANTIASYTIYDASGNDVTDQFPKVTLQSGTLTVDPFPVEFDLGFRGEEIIDEGDSDSGSGDGGSGSGSGDSSPAVFEYMGHPYFPEWVRASYEGTDEPVDPIACSYDGEVAGAYSFTFTLPYGAKLELNGTGYRDAGSYTFEPESTFLEGKKTNYEISFANNKLEITPAELKITASATKEYDGTPLVGSAAIKVEGLADGDTISVTTTEPEPVKITDAGTINNPYTVNWLDTNPNNYTVTQEPGVLEITPKKVTITTGSTDKVYDGETLFYNSYELSPSDPWVNGAAPKITVTGSIKNVGFTPNTCMVEWKGVNPNNYTVTQELGTLTVKPVELVLIQNCAFGVSGNITIESYGLKVQQGNNVDPPNYEATPMGENRWWIQFEWGDKIEARIVVTTDETSYAITPVYDFVLGDSGNYKIDTVDATGEFDVPPVAPLDGFGMGRPAALSRSVGQAVASDDTAADQQEPPLEGSAPSESIQDAGQANEDDPEETSEEALQPLSDEPQEEPLDEPYVEPLEEEIPEEEEPQEDSSEEEPKEETSQENSSEEETSQENSSEGEL